MSLRIDEEIQKLLLGEIAFQVAVDRRRAASLNWPGRRERAESYSA